MCYHAIESKVLFHFCRESDGIENGTNSPLDEVEKQSMSGEIPAYKSANQELAGVLKNLRKIEQHIKGK